MAGPYLAREFLLGFIAGCVAVVVVLAAAAFSLIRSGDIYGLGHWKLNLKTPLPSMWMNLGFWWVFISSPCRVSSNICVQDKRRWHAGRAL